MYCYTIKPVTPPAATVSMTSQMICTFQLPARTSNKPED